MVKKIFNYFQHCRCLKTLRFFDEMQSEDLPHKSGITTVVAPHMARLARSEDLPHKSGITTSIPLRDLFAFKSEDLPHKSGITTPANITANLSL